MNKQLENTIKLDKKYYFNNFGDRSPVAFSYGKGVFLYDESETKYMDLLGGIAVNSLGHGHPKLVKAIADQAKKLIHCSSLYYIPVQSELAEALVKKTFADRAFFCNSGAEANEGAFKLARAYFYKKGIQKTKIISAVQSFHGRTLATATATGQEKYSKPFAPLPKGFVHVPYNDLAALKNEVDDTTCAVLLELIQGESGVRPADEQYIKDVSELCKKNGILLILDEVQTGMGRTGTLFAYEQYGITPDILTSAKGLAGGVPIGAILATEEAATGFAPGDHGTTFGGNPLASAAALTVLSEIEEKKLLENVSMVSAVIFKKLAAMKKKSKLISEIRGKGFLIGIELSSPIAVQMKNKLLEKGYLVGSIGDNVLRLAPPLILKKKEALMFLSDFSDVVSEFEK